MPMDLKIYFAGSIRSGREDAEIYSSLVDFLHDFGEVLTEHVGDPELTEKGDDGPNDRFIHDRDMKWLKDCDLVVAEVTKPSLGVGYELAWATAWNKPALCLFRNDSKAVLSAMIAGSPALENVKYSSLEEAKQHIRSFIANNYPSHLQVPVLKDIII